MSAEEEIAVPQMVGFELLTKMIIGYLKVGGDRERKTAKEVATVAKVSRDNVARNSKFFRSIGILEGTRGRFGLTPNGAQYAKSLDWGRLDEANKLLREVLKDRQITKRVLGFVDINKPVTRDALVAQIAIIAGVGRARRYETGIRGFVDMLVTAELLEESAEGSLTVGKPAEKRFPEEKKQKEVYPEPTLKIQPPKPTALPISLNFHIDTETDIEHLKRVLKAIREVLTEG